MDPFEARLQFIQILETLNPSSIVLTKAIQFSLKNLELHEDFHSCILEILDKLDLNARINILYFLEALVQTILKDRSGCEKQDMPYVQNIKKDLQFILSKVIPNENLINLTHTVDIIANLEREYHCENTKQQRLYEELSIENYKSEQYNVEVRDEDDVFTKCWNFLILNKKKAIGSRLEHLESKDPNGMGEKDINYTREQILNRIETDRERHKRFKETSWTVNRTNNFQSLNIIKIDPQEFDKLWDSFNAIDEEDLQELKELNETAKESYGI